MTTLGFFQNMGGGSMILIVLVILLLFGAKRIPELARGLGRGIREFKDATKDIQNDLEEGMKPDGCVIDEGRINDCIYAREGMRKEQCEYWKIIASDG